ARRPRGGTWPDAAGPGAGEPRWPPLPVPDWRQYRERHGGRARIRGRAGENGTRGYHGARGDGQASRTDAEGREKAPRYRRYRGALVAGAGFEPATSGL